MARKDPEITKRIKQAIAETGLKYPAFADKADLNYRSMMGYLMPGRCGFVPEWDQLVKIAAATGKSIDWLLTGLETAQARHVVAEGNAPYNVADECDWPADVTDQQREEIRRACKSVQKIYLSDHRVIKPALQSNLAAFEYSIDKEKEQDKEIKQLKKRVGDLERGIRSAPPTGTDQAASSSTGKRET